jgi:hypothetical protein
MKAYYEWMQTTKIEIVSIVGTFVKGETIISASGATAVIREVTVGELIVQVNSRKPFSLLEEITGQTSLATANISLVKDNVVRKTGKLLEYRSLETSIDQYVDYLRDELYPSIPVTYYGDKRAVAARFKELFISKSNEDSYRFLFKLLYNDNIEFYYPGEDVLRVSDGNFEKTQIIRTVATATGTNALGAPFDRDIFLFLNKTIRGQSSGFLANVVDIKKFFIGSREVAEMTLKLVSGTFTAGENIVDIDDDNLVTTIYGIVSSVTIVDGGSGYEEGDIITIAGDGSEAQAKVSSIKESPISALTINSVGHGYQLNTLATIDNTGTGGSGFIVKVTELANTYSVTSGANTYTVGEVSQVSIINRGEGYFKKPSITLQDTTIASLGLLSENLITISNAGSNYGVGNTLVFTGGAGANAAGQIASVVESTTFDLLFEDGMKMKADGSYYDIIKNEDWAVVGPIKRIELTNFGTGYSSANLPSISISTTTGSSANLVATNIQGKSANVIVDTSNNITGIGSIRAVEITNFGINYSTANAIANAVGDGNAILTPVISGLGIKEGVWLDDDGKVDYKIIQDSYYYQDYSYVIKSGLTFQTYSDTLKQILHPAGLIYFGEIQILNDLDVHAELINSDDIQRMLVQIFGYATVGAEFEYSNISWTVQVESDIINVNTDLSVQEYVVHLVSGGDDENAVSDVGVVINEGAVRHTFVIQTPFEIDVTSTSATLPTTKFVVSKFDIIPGYGYNTYGNLPIAPFGVYGDDWSIVPISEIQDVRFSDLYGENPAYQSITNLFIQNSVDVSTLDTTTKLKYEIFNSDDTIADFVYSSIAPQKFASAQNLIYLYRIDLGDVSIGEVLNQTFNDLSPQSLYDLSGVTYASSTFESIYTVQPTQAQEYVKVLYPTITGLENLSVNKQVVVSFSGNGFKYTLYDDLLLSDYASTPISSLSDITFDSSFGGITTDDITIKATTSPYSGGQSLRKNPTDIFRNETQLEISSETDVYSVPYDELPISALSEYALSDTLYDIPLSSETFGTTYPSIYTESEYIKYAKIAGTVSSANAEFSTLSISSFSSTPIGYVDGSILSGSAPLVIGSGTDFVSDFSLGSVFVANNEYFKIDSIANTTYMVTDRLPASTFTNVFAYKQSI